MRLYNPKTGKSFFQKRRKRVDELGQARELTSPATGDSIPERTIARVSDDRNVIETATVHQMIDYIHANPVRRGLVADAEDWPWSRRCWFAGIRPVPVEIDGKVPLHHETVH